MTVRRRRNLFPGVPAPGGPDVDATHAYPGLAAELRDEPPQRRDPAVSVYGGDPPLPAREPEPPAPESEPTPEHGAPGSVEAATWDALHDGSFDLPPADVEQWRTEQRPPEEGSGLGPAPSSTPYGLPGWSTLDPQDAAEFTYPQQLWAVDEDSQDGPEERNVRAISDGTAPEGDETEPSRPGVEVDPSHPEGIEIRIACGCRFTLHPCSL